MSSPETEIFQAEMNSSAEGAPPTEQAPASLDAVIRDLKKEGKFSKRDAGFLRHVLNRCEVERAEIGVAGKKEEDGATYDKDTLDKMRAVVDKTTERIKTLLKGFPEETRTNTLGALHNFLWRFSTAEEKVRDYGVKAEVGVSVPVAKEPQLSENKNMSKEEIPVSGGASSSERRPNKPEIPQEVQESIESVLTEAKKVEEALESGAAVLTDPAKRREMFESSHRSFGERVHEILENWQKSTGQPVLGGIPEEYWKRLPGDKYVRGGRGVAGQVADSVREDLGGEKRRSSGKKAERVSEKSTDSTEHADNADAVKESPTERLERAKKRRQERGVAGEKSPEKEESAPEKELQSDKAMADPDFEKFMLAYFPDGETGELTDERLETHLVAFRRHQATMNAMTEIIVAQERELGMIDVTKDFQKDIFNSFNEYLLKNVRSQPELIRDIQISLQRLEAAPGRIAEKEKVLAEFGSSEKLLAEQKSLEGAAAKRKRLEALYGKGILNSFLKGFSGGFRETPQELRTARTELGDVMTSTDKKVGIWDRIRGGWRTGREAMRAAEGAEKELMNPGFKKIMEALDTGVLDNLELKIRNVQDAERAKENQSRMFGEARALIFDHLAQASGVTDKLKKKTQATLVKMFEGGGDVKTMQENFEHLSRVREKVSSRESAYIDTETLDEASERIDLLIELEFEEQIHKVLATQLDKKNPFGALQDMLARFAGLENLGSKHSEKVREFFTLVVKDYLKNAKDVPPAKKLMLSRLVVVLGTAKPAKAEKTPVDHAEADEEHDGAEHVDAHEEGTVEERAEGHGEKPEFPKIGEPFTLTFEADGKKHTDKEARVTKYKRKGAEPRPGDVMEVSASYVNAKGNRMKVWDQITYAQYLDLRKRNGKSKQEHA